MIRPLEIPYKQLTIIGAMEAMGWQLLGYVEHTREDWRKQEAVLKKNGQFKRVLPSGAVRSNPRWNWRTDQDLTVIYPELSDVEGVGEWLWQFRQIQRQRLLKKQYKSMCHV